MFELDTIRDGLYTLFSALLYPRSAPSFGLLRDEAQVNIMKSKRINKHGSQRTAWNDLGALTAMKSRRTARISWMENNSVSYIFLWKRTTFIQLNLCWSQNYCRIFLRTKFSYKIDCILRLQSYSISFYWKWILTNLLLDNIFFLYSPCLQNF